jgi:hypothetical protein
MHFLTSPRTFSVHGAARLVPKRLQSGSEFRLPAAPEFNWLATTLCSGFKLFSPST